jgi:cell division protein FtsW
LVSMGGSSFLFTCGAIGIILSVARNVEQLEGKEPVLAPILTPRSPEGAVVKPIEQS